jgi:hypothetical protein
MNPAELQAGEVEIRIIVSPAYPESWDQTVETLKAADPYDYVKRDQP